MMEGGREAGVVVGRGRVVSIVASRVELELGKIGQTYQVRYC